MPEVRFKRRLWKSGGSTGLALPATLLEALGLKDGDFVDIFLQDNKIMVKKVKT